MRVLFLGKQEDSLYLSQHGFIITFDPEGDYTVVISDTSSYRFAPDDKPLIIILGQSVSDFIAKKNKPDAIFVTNIQEAVSKIQGMAQTEVSIRSLLPDRTPKTKSSLLLNTSKEKLLVLTHSNKGGVGKSSCAVAIATTMANLGVNTALADFDFPSPDIASSFALKIKPGANYLKDGFDSEKVLSSLVKIKPCLSILPGPADLYLPAILSNDLIKVIDTLYSQFDLIVGDTSPAPWEKSYMHDLFASADMVFSVVDQSKYSMDETAKYAPTLLAMNVNPANIKIVVNRYNPKLANLRDVEKNFCRSFKKDIKTLPTIAGVIPEGWEAQVKALYQGEILNTQEWVAICKDIIAFFGKSDLDVTDTDRKGLFPWFRKNG